VQETLLKVSIIDVFHSTLQALWNVSLTIETGEIVALIGTNSSGKSTLLNTISNLIHPAKGSIEFEGRDITALTPYETVDLGISQVPEGRGIFPDMTVLDNLIIGSYNRKARLRREQNLEMAYRLFPRLEARKSQLGNTLSGGEQQMLAIGRGLMSAPKLLLLDEISLGLAPLLVNSLYEALKKIKREGITIFFVEQNVRRSLSEAERAYILEGGRVVLSGPVTELREEEKIREAYFGV
jgi:branched-chain amino acid transport system ATP-binding protein